jgi:ribosomal protein S4
MMRKNFKNKRKLLYKKCLNFRTNVQYRKRLLLFKFKKRKWNNFIHFLKRTSKRRNSFYKLYDVNRYILSQTSAFFHKRYKTILHNKQKTSFYYGGLKMKFWKKQINYVLTRKKSFLKLKLFKHLVLLSLLERRLDVLLYRAHFVSSIRNARQLIQQGHVNLNNSVTTESSVLLKDNDKISLNIVSKNLVHDNLKNSTLWPLPPKYLAINYKTFEIIFMDTLNTHNYSMNFPVFLPNFYLLFRFSKYV